MQYIKLLQKRGQLSSCAGCSHMHLPYNALENLKISAITNELLAHAPSRQIHIEKRLESLGFEAIKNNAITLMLQYCYSK